MSSNYRLELQHAFQVYDRTVDQQTFDLPPLDDFTKSPSEDDWSLMEFMYSIGVETGYAKGFVHATALLFVLMLGVAVWTSM